MSTNHITISDRPTAEPTAARNYDGEPGDFAGANPALEPDEHLVTDNLLIEDISIDGMCGVY